MTLTETRPRAASASDAAAERAPAGPGGWLTTGDHKRLGLLFMAGGVAALLAGCVASLIYQLPSMGDAPTLWTAAGSRLVTTNSIVSLLIGIPALWIGLATYVVPLQTGATRLALPRLHHLALWTYFAGGVLVAIGILADDKAINSLTSSVPQLAAKGKSANSVTELLIAGVFVVGVALLLAAISLLTTVLSRRAEGLRLVFLPLFSWSTLATATVLVLATPVFLAGVVLLWFDQHYGGTLFAAGVGARRIWQHELWLVVQTFALLFAAACVGAFGDIVATRTGRPLKAFPVARAAAIAAPMLTLLLWTGNVSLLHSPFGPVATVGGVVVGLPLLLSLLTWLGSVKGTKPTFHPAVLFVVAFLLLIGLVTVLSVAAIFTKVEGFEAESFRNGQIALLMFGAPLLALAGAASHWSSRLFGRSAAAGAAGLQCLLLFVGPVLTAAPGYAIGFGVDPSDALQYIGCLGSAITAAGLLLFVVNLVTRSRDSVAARPGEGLTLEWATSSPPAPHNFEEIPDIRSPYPLADAGASA
jgi:cytochrome c oxidase subunit 1